RPRTPGLRRAAALAAALMFAAVLSGVVDHTSTGYGQSPPPAAWRSWGHDLHNTRSQPAESRINPANAALLSTKWVYTPGGSITATPTIDSNVLYYTDWDGNVVALNALTG